MARGASIFDLDGTLTTTDTFVAYLLGYLWRHPRRWVRAVPLSLAALLYILRVRDNSWLKAMFIGAILGGATRAGLTAWTETFLEDVLANRLRAEGLREMERRREAGDLIVLATAAIDLYVVPLAQRLGFDATLCTPVSWDGYGRLGGALSGVNCYGDAKLSRVEAFLLEADIAGPITVYSDHHADLPLLRRADHPVAVCPTRRLRAAAKKATMPIHDWSASAQR